MFSEFAKISGLELNLDKCVVIPLNRQPLDEARRQLAISVPEWHNMQVADCGTYLGFVIGPGKKDQSWIKAAANSDQE